MVNYYTWIDFVNVLKISLLQRTHTINGFSHFFCYPLTQFRHCIIPFFLKQQWGEKKNLCKSYRKCKPQPLHDNDMKSCWSTCWHSAGLTRLEDWIKFAKAKYWKLMKRLLLAVKLNYARTCHAVAVEEANFNDLENWKAKNCYKGLKLFTIDFHQASNVATFFFLTILFSY